MIKTEDNPNVVDLWHEGQPLPSGRHYNDDETIIKIDNQYYEGFDAFISECYNYPRNVFGFDIERVTGVRLDGTMIEVFYIHFDGDEEDSMHFDYKHINVVSLIKL